MKSPARTPARRRGFVDRGDHLDQFVLHGDLDPETAELAAGLGSHVVGGFLVEVAGMRIERGQHAVDGALDQFVLLGRSDILRAHALKYIAENGKLPIGRGPRCIGGAP